AASGKLRSLSRGAGSRGETEKTARRSGADSGGEFSIHTARCNPPHPNPLPPGERERNEVTLGHGGCSVAGGGGPWHSGCLLLASTGSGGAPGNPSPGNQPSRRADQ